jgi:hypothetical protein
MTWFISPAPSRQVPGFGKKKVGKGVIQQEGGYIEDTIRI